ncbi:putative structural protein [Rhizobium phage RHph_I1_18]|nr:putative structural protein [Rhizobium phage RHph_I1_18]
MIVYVRRVNGAIVEVCGAQQPGNAYEPLSDDNIEVVEFLAPKTDASSYIIGKSTPWRRMSDAEAVAVDAASYISTEDELFGTLKALLSTVLSPTRADDLLAPEV